MPNLAAILWPVDHDGYIPACSIRYMAKAALENAILYMVRTYVDSGLVTAGEVDEILDRVRRRAAA